MPAESERLVLESDLDQVAHAAGWIEEIAARRHLDADLVFALQLCLEEAASNIVCHAYAEPGRREIMLTLDAAPGSLTLTIEDDGIPFDLRQFPPSARPDRHGIDLIRQFTRRIDYERSDGRNRLRLEFGPKPA